MNLVNKAAEAFHRAANRISKMVLSNDAEFNAWYNQGDLTERLSAPGILDAARHGAICSDPGYLAMHELESTDALKTDDYLRMSRNTFRNVYTQSDPHALGLGMAPTLQIGRMDTPADIEDKYNYYYDNFRTPGCLLVRRYHALEGEPEPLTMYEFEHEKVLETLAWEHQRAQDTMHEYIGGTYGHAHYSPGVNRRILPTRAS